MAAVVCWGIGEPVKVEEIQVDPPKSSEVRVKILYASVCHTDILYTKGFPIVSIHLPSQLLVSYNILLSTSLFLWARGFDIIC